MVGWNFPSNGGGLIRGVAEAGIQTFTGKEISSLARETCQNSLDAVANEKFAVTVEFQRYEIYTKDIPGFDEYKNVLNKCREYWFGNATAKKFLDRAIEQINLPKTFVLRISDYNTTGLAEPFNPKSRDGWNALTKIDGGATKIGDSAGSFGIGKNAPFANSFYRLVFYRTKNLKEECAAQGMSRLVSFLNKEDDISAGVGYYGEKEKNLPVKKINALDEIFGRTGIGTDIFIYGFNGSETWAEEIICELLENFLVAIHRNKLRVKIQNMRIDQTNLKKILGKYEDKIPTAINYYKILSGEDGVKFFEEDFHGMGKLKLGIFLGSNLNRKVLIVRKSGMKLFEQDRISGSISFTGVLELDGQELNEFFREMETPSHDKWEPGRYEKNPKLAEEYFKELRKWVRDTISNLGTENISDEVNVEGLDHMLDFDDSAIGGGSEKEKETLDDLAPPEFELVTVTSTKKTFSITKTRTKGVITDKDGDPPAIRKPGGTRPKGTRKNHTGEENPDGENIILKQDGLTKIRVIKVSDKKYRLILKVPQNISSGNLEIFAVGENNSGEKLFIKSATAADSNSEVEAAGDKIFFKNLRGNAETKISFELRDEKNYAFGVAVYED